MTLADKNLALPLEACKGVRISDAERRSLEWLAGQEVPTVVNIARVINRARAARPVLNRAPQSMAAPAPRLHARNANTVPIDIHLVSVDIQTWWWVPSKDNDPENDRKLQSWLREPGIQLDRRLPGQFLLPPDSSLPENPVKHHVGHQAPERATRLDAINGVRATVRWFLAIDNAGRRWEVRPGRGRRARRIRWYSRRREYYPGDWQTWFTNRFLQARDLVRRLRKKISRS